MNSPMPWEPATLFTNLSSFTTIISLKKGGFKRCNSEGAEIPFDNILDRVTGSDPSVTDYILEQPAKCPKLQAKDFWKRLSSSPTEMKMPSPGSSAEPQFAAREDGAGQDEYDNGVKEVLGHHFEVEPVLGMHEFSRK